MIEERAEVVKFIPQDWVQSSLEADEVSVIMQGPVPAVQTEKKK